MNDKSIAWQVALKASQHGASLVLTKLSGGCTHGNDK
jgi:enoyl-[acyl-carrier-protein] reductase (NADH)